MTQSVNNLTSADTAVPQTLPSGLATLALLLAGIVVVSIAALMGGMQYIMIALALGLAALVAFRPEEAVPAGWMFMLAAMILLPSSARLVFIDSRYANVSWQMYYWAVGSLMIVLAALYRIGLSPLIRAPNSLKAFFLIVIASTVFGFFRGNEPSYVIRQAYGSILFVLYFVIAREVADEESVFRRLRSFGVLMALTFIVYYASVFSTYGFHKEDSSLATQMGMFATLLFVKGLIQKRLFWISPAVVLFAASFLLFMRHILLTFFFAAALALAVQSGSRIRRLFCFGVAAVILLPSIFPFGAQYVLDVLEKDLPGIYQLMPAGTHDTKTLMDRNIELATSAAVLVKSPIIGAGMGADFAWTRPGEVLPEFAFIDKPFVDNGWAYVVVKMGCAGILAFGWVLITVLRCMSRQSLTLSVSLLSILMIAMFSEPVCFQFTMSPIAGALAGLLYAKKHPEATKYRLATTRISKGMRQA
jgi:hypothetical protein